MPLDVSIVKKMSQKKQHEVLYVIVCVLWVRVCVVVSVCVLLCACVSVCVCMTKRFKKCTCVCYLCRNCKYHLSIVSWCLSSWQIHQPSVILSHTLVLHQGNMGHVLLSTQTLSVFTGTPYHLCMKWRRPHNMTSVLPTLVGKEIMHGLKTMNSIDSSFICNWLAFHRSAKICKEFSC